MQSLRYRTRTGALVRVDGVAYGAFDRDHETLPVPTGGFIEITLEVERRGLPGVGLPSGDGLRWRYLIARANDAPSQTIEIVARKRAVSRRRADLTDLPVVAHSHLDVAWLWTFEDAARKALRTFATAVRQLETYPEMVFTQTQPQLYAIVEERDPDLASRARKLAREHRFDGSGAAMWVETDCNLPSGESLLRQLMLGVGTMVRDYGIRPTVAWLPDSFGFANTLPTLLRHAGVTAFGTTKLGWNDTTDFPYTRFVWEGPDGSRIVAAQIASIGGDVARSRVDRARTRGDLLLIGNGDGGGGATDAMIERSRGARWVTLARWFSDVAADVDLPVVRDELFLQTHRATATTHHDVKARNAELERALLATETALAWAAALRASPYFLTEARAQLTVAWQVVLRGQFHDLLAGTAIAAAYDELHADFDDAARLIAHVRESARAVLPRARAQAPVTLAPPIERRGGYTFTSPQLFARVRRDGLLDILRAVGDDRNRVRSALRLAAYVDRPQTWDAWNLDRTYRFRPIAVRHVATSIVGDALELRYVVGTSLAVMRVELRVGEPFLRVTLAVDWRERHVILRMENTFRFVARRARFGTPHGAVDRAPHPRSRAERAKFEAPGQRFARIDGATGGAAILTRDTYGWSLERAWPSGAARVGHSLLRAPTWPDPDADRGEHRIAVAFLPFAHLHMGELETLWERFVESDDVPMFTSDAPNVVVTATKLAEDGDGIIVRARECDGRATGVSLRCGARPVAAMCVDALELETAGDVRLEAGALMLTFAPFELRSFRVRLA